MTIESRYIVPWNIASSAWLDEIYLHSTVSIEEFKMTPGRCRFYNEIYDVIYKNNIISFKSEQHYLLLLLKFS